MGPHGLRRMIQEALQRDVLVKTATASLTDEEVMNNLVINGNHASAAIALTLPAAGAANAGAFNIIRNYGAAVVTVVVAAGFGGVDAGGDTLTLAQGEFVIVNSDGSYWYKLHNEPAA